jgi:hypothetical protein
VSGGGGQASREGGRPDNGHMREVNPVSFGG